MNPIIPRSFLLITLAFAVFASTLRAMDETLELTSPDGNLVIRLEVGHELRWSVRHGDRQVLEPGRIALNLASGEILGYRPVIRSHDTAGIDRSFATPHYRKAKVRDHCRELQVEFEGGYGLVLRAYDEAAAYRFVVRREEPLVIHDEVVQFDFSGDPTLFVPYMNDYRGGAVFNHSFEAYYDEAPLSAFRADAYAFLPLLADLGGGLKVALLEADLEDYPGMYLERDSGGEGLSGVFPRYPLETTTGGYRGMNLIPTRRAPEIARTDGDRVFPWRVAVVSTRDEQLLDCDIVQQLASPSRIEDESWIQPGLAVWDWWHEWTLEGVDFKAGQNTETYLYHLAFAARHNLPFIVIDWGWTDILDLHERNPDVDLEAIVAEGERLGVGVMVWASWQAVCKARETIFAELEEVGVKGMKIDFIDRDDQLAVASVYDIARRAADHHLLVNYHGIYKPTGLQRTFPNVVNFEGVKGLENEKWADEDAPRNAVLVPFIRMLAGPMDYTPGAMRNAAAARFAPINDAPMSKGTRCHQLAMYVVYEAPFQMLCDSPSRYLDAPRSLEFISRIPTRFDETVPLSASVGEHVAVARRQGDTWYVGALTNWTPRELVIDTSFLGSGRWEVTIASDGVNADKEGTDHRFEERTVSAGDRLPAALAPGGGWAAIFRPSTDR